jgi:hypothetical protein
MASTSPLDRARPHAGALDLGLLGPEAVERLEQPGHLVGRDAVAGRGGLDGDLAFGGQRPDQVDGVLDDLEHVHRLGRQRQAAGLDAGDVSDGLVGGHDPADAGAALAHLRASLEGGPDQRVAGA